MHLRKLSTKLLTASLLIAACKTPSSSEALRSREPPCAEPIVIGADVPAAGWAAPFRVRVAMNCEEAKRGHIRWRKLDGDATEIRVSANGLELEGKTPSFAIAERPWGIVPVSPRTRGTSTFEATWIGESGRISSLVVRVSAATRATGVPSIARGQEVLLGGDGWQIVRANPPDARAHLAPVATGLTTFRSDVIGQYVLRDRRGKLLSIRANTHERVPLDCGRSDCHRETTEAAQASPMTHVLHEALDGAFGPAHDVECAIGCHAAGEPGLPDDGFVAVRAALRFDLPSPRAGAYDELPRSLRRLGGVGCTSCHGPAAIPEPTGRFAILRADVCATCHDAPPRYEHVVDWKASAMAHADRDDTAARDPSCQRCHTTAGFLRTLSKAPREDAPDSARPVGIACAACHTPHGPHVAAQLREVKLAPAYAALESKSRICVPCHDGGAATVWAGTPELPSPHASLGCVTCHMQNAHSHSFRVDRAMCRTCHPSGEPQPRTRPRAKGTPPHATKTWDEASANEKLRRAALEDRAGWVHNARAATFVARPELHRD